MLVYKSKHPDSEPYVLALTNNEFIHLYRAICSILYEDNSDNVLVELESLMVHIL